MSKVPHPSALGSRDDRGAGAGAGVERLVVEPRRGRPHGSTTRFAVLAVACGLAMAALVLVLLGVVDDTDPLPGTPHARNGALLAAVHTGAVAAGGYSPVRGDAGRLPTDVARWSDLQLTADGRSAVYHARGGTVSVADLTTGSTRVLARCLDEVCSPALSPDGRRLAFGGRDRLRMVTVGTDEVDAMPLRGVGITGRPAWSPDGTRIAFRGGRHVWVVGVDGHGLRRVHTEGLRLAPWTSLAWAPDGRRLALLAADLQPGARAGQDRHALVDTRFTASTLDLRTGATEVLHDAGHCACAGLPVPSLTWSPDGRWIAVATTQHGSPGIWLVRPDGSGWHRLAAGYFENVAWQPRPD